MKKPLKGTLQLLFIVVVIGALTAIALIGIGNQHKGSAQNIKLGLDLAGGVSITYQAEGEPTQTEMSDTIYKLQQKVEKYSTEAEVYQEGNNRINIDIPNVTDSDKVLKELGKPGNLEFRLEDGTVILDGSNVEKAEAGQYVDNNITKYIVSLKLDAEGTKAFATATSNLVSTNGTIGIYFDDKEISSPSVQSVISNGEAQITGQKSYAEAEELATNIRNGALDLKLTELRSNVVGAKLGQEALSTSLMAGFIGFLAILVYMIVLYRIPGVAASLALSLYVALMMVALNGLDLTLTLPGIAGIVLSIGMAVDANVIIFTRIKEELLKGKTVRTSIKLGFDKALSAIIDGNVTTLIAAFVLYFIGSGTVKGFATTLALGIILSMFTALTITKFLVNAFYSLGFDDVKFYGTARIFKTFNYVKNFKKYILVSITVFVVGIAFMAVNSSKGNGVFSLGLDFVGGSSSNVPFEQKIDAQLIKDVQKAYYNIIGEQPTTSEVNGENTLIIKTKELDQATREKVNNMLESDFNVDLTKVTTENISGAVSDEMKSDAVVAVLVATLCMLLYIWFRFKDINFGSAAIIALLHDVIIVVMVYAILRISVGSTFIACLLTIVGYSINATIVIFDRIRENKGTVKTKERLAEVVNESISQTFTRSVNTSLTTFIMVFVLFILGVDSLKEFTLPIMAGILFGGFSSVCITGPLYYFFKSRFDKNLK